jgi:hypothetical protein
MAKRKTSKPTKKVAANSSRTPKTKRKVTVKKKTPPQVKQQMKRFGKKRGTEALDTGAGEALENAQKGQESTPDIEDESDIDYSDDSMPDLDNEDDD